MTSQRTSSKLPHWLNDRSAQIMSLLVVGIFALGFALRLFDLTDQPIDFHSTRQLRNAVVARGIYYELSPNVDETLRKKAIAYSQSTGQYEPPILENLVAVTYLILGRELLWVSRIYTTLFWIIGGLALFDLSRRIAQASVKPEVTSSRNNTYITMISALIAVAYYLVLPLSVRASRSFQPDPGMVMWAILTIYSLYRWSEKPSWRLALLAGLLGGIAVLVKIVAAYIIAGAGIALVIQSCFNKQKRYLGLTSILLNPQVWTMLVLMLAPTLIYYFTRGERSAEYFSSWTLALSHILLDPWFYLRWLNTISKLVGIISLALSLLGLLLSRSHVRALILGLWLGYIAYGLFLPYQMYSHSYYHLQLIPIVALSMTPAIQVGLKRLSIFLTNWNNSQKALIVGGLSLLGLILVSYFSWQALFPLYNKDYRNEPGYWQEIANQLPTDGKIMALTQDYGYRLMYYGWRKVTLWPNRGEQNLMKLRGSDKNFKDLFAKRAEGKSYFLVTSFRQFDDQPILKETLYENYPILVETNGFIIFDLRGTNTASP